MLVLFQRKLYYPPSESNIHNFHICRITKLTEQKKKKNNKAYSLHNVSGSQINHAVSQIMLAVMDLCLSSIIVILYLT